MKNTYRLIADSGSTKANWCLLGPRSKKLIHTQGISPYFLKEVQIEALIKKELLPELGSRGKQLSAVNFYGTGCAQEENVKMMTGILKRLFPGAAIRVTHDLMAAAHALCGQEKGLACILGTGSNSCYYNGKKIMKNNPGLGYILGDEGSGAWLGRKVLQYYLYRTFDQELMADFDQKYHTDKAEILDNVYRRPFANRYLASFTYFLEENRGHYMIENILEDGLNDFFFQHICKYVESWKYPVHFTGGVAWAFRDVVAALCQGYELTLGTISREPMEGLIHYYREEA